MVELIPKFLDDYLPFSSVAFNSWNDNTDLLHFLYALFDKPAELITPNGEHIKTNYRSYGKFVYEQGQKKIKTWIEKFDTIAKESEPAPAAAVQKIEIPQFITDPKFGKTAKYIIAFDGVISEILQEGEFYSISHILESEADLECSILLAANLYYKHSLQVLRSMLENLILPIHFSNNEADFRAWRVNNYKTPRFRGRDGILKNLVSRNLLTKELAKTISDLYGDLSKSIHGSERFLVHKGLHTGIWMGQIFTISDFYQWCDILSNILDIAIRLLRIHVIQWKQVYSNRGILCEICLNDNDFDIESEEFGNEQYVTYQCRQCGHKMTLKANSKVITVTFNGDKVGRFKS